MQVPPRVLLNEAQPCSLDAARVRTIVRVGNRQHAALVTASDIPIEAQKPPAVAAGLMTTLSTRELLVYGVAPGLRPAVELDVPAPNSCTLLNLVHLKLRRSKSNVLDCVPNFRERRPSATRGRGDEEGRTNRCTEPPTSLPCQLNNTKQTMLHIPKYESYDSRWRDRHRYIRFKGHGSIIGKAPYRVRNVISVAFHLNTKSKIGIHNKGTSKKLASARVQAGPGIKSERYTAEEPRASITPSQRGLPKVRGGKCLAHTQRCIEFLDETAPLLHIMVVRKARSWARRRVSIRRPAPRSATQKGGKGATHIEPPIDTLKNETDKANHIAPIIIVSAAAEVAENYRKLDPVGSEPAISAEGITGENKQSTQIVRSDVASALHFGWWGGHDEGVGVMSSYIAAIAVFYAILSNVYSDETLKQLCYLPRHKDVATLHTSLSYVAPI
ncbi:unnamed protein product [Chrysodeixis includens]|uniref:Uncharacterized protein n=1 Tax=Chrysodeixis includens TaxID=689277 RepID=A0A9N8L0J2_CHRIL|nr:unnamed protein product [Chrysodeixis includens]